MSKTQSCPNANSRRPHLSREWFAATVVLLLFAGSASTSYGQDTERTSADSDFWKSVYSDNHVLDIKITVTAHDWQKMQPEQQGRGGRGQQGRGGPGGQRQGGPPQGGPPQGGPPQGGPPGGGGPGGGGTEYTYVQAQITVDGEQYADVGLRFKGNSSYRMTANTLKRPLKFDMNKYNKKQSLHGRDKLNLSNAVFDSAFMKEKLAYGLYESAGLATPGVGWANVTLTVGNQTVPLGIYVVIEQVDKDFLKRHFGADSKDSLLMKPEVNEWQYLGDTAEAYAGYDIKNGEENSEQFQQFGQLLKLINESSDSEFESEIGKHFDLPQMAGYLAATSLLSSLDSYVGAPHNYYLMLDKADGKMRLLPWDVNESFAAHSRGASAKQLVDWDIDRPWTANRQFLERLFKTKDFPAMYRTALTNLTNEFSEEKLFPQIEAYQKAITPHVGKYKAGPGRKGLIAGINGDRQGINRSVDRQVFAIKPFITQRHKSVAAQLAGEREGQTISGGRGGGRR